MFGERIKKLRKEKGLTQEELGRKVNVTKVSISGYENGNRTPDTETLQKLADVLDTNTDYLLGRSNNHNIDDEKEMWEFFNNPELNLFFREMKEAPEEQLEELREIWEVIKKRSKKK